MNDPSLNAPFPHRRWSLLGIAASALASLCLACSGGGGEPASVTVTGITIPATASVNVGSATNLFATVTPANATNKTMTWTSSDTAIATVSSSGIVSGLKVGSVNITAKSADGSNITSNVCATTVSTAGPVTHGSQIDGTNTGVPTGRTLADVASTIIVNEEWIQNSNGGSRILQDKNFLSGASLIVMVDGFTVQYCKFFGKGGITNDPNANGWLPGKNITLLDSELDGNHENLQGDVAIGGVNTIKRVHVHRWPRAMMTTANNNIWVEECYMHDLTCDNQGAHIENIYVGGGANQTYLRNKLISNRTFVDNSTGQISASLALYNEDWGNPAFPVLNHILVQDNYFESDGGYAMYCGACVGKNQPYGRNMTISGNIFGRGEQRHCGIYGPCTAFDRDNTTNVWSNNTWGPRGPYWESGDPEEGDEVGAPPPT